MYNVFSLQPYLQGRVELMARPAGALGRLVGVQLIIFRTINVARDSDSGHGKFHPRFIGTESFPILLCAFQHHLR